MEPIEAADEIQGFDKSDWLDCFAEWKESGLSASRYCQEKGLRIHRFRYWQYRLVPATKKPSKKNKKALSLPSFIPVTLKPGAAKMDSHSKWIFYIGTKIRFEMEPLKDMDGLARLIHCLAEV